MLKIFFSPLCFSVKVNRILGLLNLFLFFKRQLILNGALGHLFSCSQKMVGCYYYFFHILHHLLLRGLSIGFTDVDHQFFLLFVGSISKQSNIELFNLFLITQDFVHLYPMAYTSARHLVASVRWIILEYGVPKLSKALPGQNLNCPLSSAALMFTMDLLLLLPILQSYCKHQLLLFCLVNVSTEVPVEIAERREQRIH